MKKFVFSMLLIFSILSSSNAQNKSFEDFYKYLNDALENKNIKSIDLFQTHYECLGNKSYWDAVLIKKQNKIEINFFSLVSKDKQNLEVLVRRLDTAYTISKKELINNLNDEIIKSEGRIIVEGTYKFIIKTQDYTNEFLIKNAEGLEYLLRYNKSYEAYRKEKLEK